MNLGTIDLFNLLDTRLRPLRVFYTIWFFSIAFFCILLVPFWRHLGIFDLEVFFPIIVCRFFLRSRIFRQQSKIKATASTPDRELLRAATYFTSATLACSKTQIGLIW